MKKTLAKTKQSQRRKTIPTESDTCRNWLKWLELQYPAVYTHVIKIANEGMTNRANAVSLGLHVGASDYFIAWPTLQHYGCWIEVKPDGWKLTKSKLAHHENQIEFGAKMKRKGYAFYFCVGLDDLIQCTQDYLNAD